MTPDCNSWILWILCSVLSEPLPLVQPAILGYYGRAADGRWNFAPPRFRNGWDAHEPQIRPPPGEDIFFFLLLYTSCAPEYRHLFIINNNTSAFW